MEDKLISIPAENIQMEFEVEGQSYVVFTNSDAPNEGDLLYFAKKEILEDGTIFIRDIQSDEEYAQVEKEFNKILDLMEDDENEN